MNYLVFFILLHTHTHVTCYTEITQKILKLGVVTYTYNPSTWKTEAEDCEFKASLSYKARTPSQKERKKKKKTSLVFNRGLVKKNLTPQSIWG
jgi:hypothetical protein